MPTFGVMMFPTDYAIQPIELAKAAEERGFDALFFPEHTHIPTSRKTPYPGGGELPKEYSHTHDPFVALGAAAAATKRIKLGTGICLVIQRDPIVLAKEVASLDRISNGRVIFGIGAGWNQDEIENHGTPFKRRWKVLRERILAMREIWTKDAAEFHGEFVNFDPIWSYPKPVQPGGPPILLGSLSPRSYERVVEYCDGWIPLYRHPETLGQGVKALREAADRAGRRFDSLKLGVSLMSADEKRIRAMMDVGFELFIMGLPPEGPEKVLPLLDSYAKLAAKFA